MDSPLTRKKEDAVRGLWTEFEWALERATDVVTIGHSLNDAVLVDRLRGVDARLVVGSPEPVGDEKERLLGLLPEAEATHIEVVREDDGDVSLVSVSPLTLRSPWKGPKVEHLA